MIEQSLLDYVFQAARCKWCAAVLLLGRQFFAQPRHRPIDVMQLEAIGAGDRIVLPPAIRRAIGAAAEQPVQHGEEHRPLQRKAVLAPTGKFLDHGAAAGLLPQPLEHQSRPDASAGDPRRRVVIERTQHHRLFGKSRTGSQQPLQLAAGLEILVASQRGDHLLANLVALASALDDLQIGAPARRLAAKVHARLRCRCAQSRDSSAKIKQ